MYTDLGLNQKLCRGTSPLPTYFLRHSNAENTFSLLGVLTAPNPPKKSLWLNHSPPARTLLDRCLTCSTEVCQDVSTKDQKRSPRRAFWRRCGGRSRPPLRGVWGAAPQAQDSGFDRASLDHKTCVYTVGVDRNGKRSEGTLNANTMDTDSNNTDINLKPVLDFLAQLQENNSRDWFEQHRAAYQNAKAQFESLVAQVIEELRAIEDLGDITAKDCVMRIYRDVRFSKDKAPYRTNMAAAIAAGGKKSPHMPYYLHLAPHNESFLAGGLYMPTGAQLAKFRETIDHNAKPFKALINHKTFKHWFGELSSEKLKTAPQGYARDHPEIELLRLKQVIATHPLSDEALLGNALASQIIEIFRGLKPLLDYLNDTVAGIN